MRPMCSYLTVITAAVSLSLVYLVWQGLISLPAAILINLGVVLLLRYFVRTMARCGMGLPFLPAALWLGLGPVWLAAACVFEKWEVCDRDQLHAYHLYTQSMEDVSEARALSHVDVVRDVNLIGGAAELLHSDQLRKKQLIVRSADVPEHEQISLLRRALHDVDPEVRHYAATILARVSQQYDEAIFALAQRAGRDAQALLKLLHMYDRLLASNLPVGKIRHHYLHEYLKWLLIAVNSMPDDLSVNAGLLNVYLELERWDEALTFVPKLERILPKQAYAWAMAMKTHYGTRDYAQVAHYARVIREVCQEVPDEYRGIVSFWS